MRRQVTYREWECPKCDYTYTAARGLVGCDHTVRVSSTVSVIHTMRPVPAQQLALPT